MGVNIVESAFLSVILANQIDLGNESDKLYSFISPPLKITGSRFDNHPEKSQEGRKLLLSEYEK